MKKSIFFGMSSLFIVAAAAGALAQIGGDLPTERQRRDRIEAAEDNGTVRNNETSRRERYREELEARRRHYKERITDRKAQYREHLETRREEMRQRWEEHRARLNERHKKIIRSHIERLAHRFQAAIDRMNVLADKIETRISAVGEAGGGTTAGDANLVVAREALVHAQTTYNEALTALEMAPDADNPADGIGQARLLFEEVKAELREAHAALADTIAVLKGLSTTIPAEE